MKHNKNCGLMEPASFETMGNKCTCGALAKEPQDANEDTVGQSRSTDGLGLPPLPPAFGLFVGVRLTPPKTTEFFGYLYGTTGPEEKCDLFTTAQMVEYAQQAIEAHQEDIFYREQAQSQEREMVTVTREMAMDAGCPDMEGDRIQW